MIKQLPLFRIHTFIILGLHAFYSPRRDERMSRPSWLATGLDGSLVRRRTLIRPTSSTVRHAANSALCLLLDSLNMFDPYHVLGNDFAKYTELIFFQFFSTSQGSAAKHSIRERDILHAVCWKFQALSRRRERITKIG